MRQYLYRLTPTRLEMVTEGPTDDERRVVGEHFQYLTGLAAEGRVLLFGRTQNNDEQTMGLAILQADSEEEARRIMENDPAVKNRVMQASLYPYQIAGMSLPALQLANEEE